MSLGPDFRKKSMSVCVGLWLNEKMNWLYPHSTLQIEPTRRCNLNCEICMRQNLSDTNTLLSLKDFKNILNSLNFQHVALHGWGEPLLNAKLFDMIKHAESQGVSTELTTNATLLQPNIEKIFASGLSIIAFGIHSKENLLVVKPQIKELITQRDRKKMTKPRTYVDIVIYRRNQNEVADLVESAAELNVDSIVLHRVFNIHKADNDVGYISIKEEKSLFESVKSLAKRLNIELHLPPKPSVPCRAIKYSIFVTSKGKVTPCPYFTEACMGDAFKKGTSKITYSNKYMDFLKHMDKSPICTKCPLGSTNGAFYS